MPALLRSVALAVLFSCLLALCLKALAQTPGNDAREPIRGLADDHVAMDDSGSTPRQPSPWSSCQRINTDLQGYSDTPGPLAASS